MPVLSSSFGRRTSHGLADLRIAGLGMPVLGFLAGCIAQRRQITAILRTRMRELHHLPPAFQWLAGTLAVGVASFGVPALALSPPAQGAVLIGAMLLITIFVVTSVRNIVLAMRDVAATLESISARFDQFATPLVAFLTVYLLLVVVFGCLYRIADLSYSVPLFLEHGAPTRSAFSDALYYSVSAITTLGFGDIAPVGPLVRALTGIEVISGVLMLLFGFSEIMRVRGR